MRVLIIGGGIGGLTAALALRRREVPVAVYEAAPALEAAGAGLWVPPNAMQVFARLGLAEALQEAGVALEWGVVQTPGGTVLQEIDLADAGERFGGASVGISRSALQRILLDHLPEQVLHLGMACAGFSEKGEQVTARFEDGTEVTGEVLVGADGAASGVRRRLFPSATLREAGQVSYRGLARQALSPAGQHTGREIWGDGARFGFSPVGGGQVYWFTAQRGSEAPLASAAPEAVKTALAERYAAFPAPAPALIEGTSASEIIRTELQDLPPMRRWHRGRVALLGDAAHAATPNLGQGAAQAVEDAYVLAQALAEHATPQAAFSFYEDVRMKKAHRVVRRSRQLGRMAHWHGPWARRLRDGLLKLAPAALQRRQLQQLYELGF